MVESYPPLQADSTGVFFVPIHYSRWPFSLITFFRCLSVEMRGDKEVETFAEEGMIHHGGCL
jgi:hypothetical protein